MNKTVYLEIGSSNIVNTDIHVVVFDGLIWKESHAYMDDDVSCNVTSIH